MKTLHSVKRAQTLTHGVNLQNCLKAYSLGNLNGFSPYTLYIFRRISLNIPLHLSIEDNDVEYKIWQINLLTTCYVLRVL